MKAVVIGIDIGGTYTKFGIVDRSGNCLVKASIATGKYEDVNEYLAYLHQQIENQLRRIEPEISIKGIGIGAPNGNYLHGTIEFAPNLKWKGIVNLVGLFKLYYNLPMVLTNDANAAAIGEMLYGGAKGMKDFIVITLGTGLGSGIVVNGELLYGHNGFAGEIGHTIVRPNGRICGCGRRGCLETYVSAPGLIKTVTKMLADSSVASELRKVKFEELSAKMITEAAKKGDTVALEAFEYTGKILGMKLVDSVAHTNPEAIFLFGGLAQAGELIIVPAKKHFEKNLLYIYKNKVKLVPSGLKNENAAILGASALAWQELGEH